MNNTITIDTITIKNSQAYCSVCKREYTHPYELESIEWLGMCLGCDKAYGDYLTECISDVNINDDFDEEQEAKYL